MTRKQINNVMEEITRLLKENPSWIYKKAIDKAKELINNESQRPN